MPFFLDSLHCLRLKIKLVLDECASICYTAVVNTGNSSIGPDTHNV